MKGIYTLRGWGYKRPFVSMHEAVYRIVKENYNCSGKPASFNVVLAEIGKYRQVVKKQSLKADCYCNPKITAVENNKFVPSEKIDSYGGKFSYIYINELDKRLRLLGSNKAKDDYKS